MFGSQMSCSLFTNKIIYNMKPISRIPKQQNFYTLQSNVKCLSSCCPVTATTINTPSPFKKQQKFINVTISKQKAQIPAVPTVISQEAFAFQAEKEQSVQKQENFEQDKSSFLQQIRKYNPNPEFTKQYQVDKHMKSLDTTKEMDYSRRTNQSNNLSTMLQNFSNEIFSEMFVSSTVKGKIVLSASLGSIPEVKSEMEMSNPTETIINHLHYTEER